jgi:hypothetical protein
MPSLKGWITVKGVPKQWGQTTHPLGHPFHGQPIIEAVRFQKFTVAKPNVDEDCVAFQVELDIDESWFLTSVATIKGTVPAVAGSETIDVQIDVPVKPRGKSAAAAAIGGSAP